MKGSVCCQKINELLSTSKGFPHPERNIKNNWIVPKVNNLIKIHSYFKKARPLVLSWLLQTSLAVWGGVFCNSSGPMWSHEPSPGLNPPTSDVKTYRTFILTASWPFLVHHFSHIPMPGESFFEWIQLGNQISNFTPANVDMRDLRFKGIEHIAKLRVLETLNLEPLPPPAIAKE